MSINAAAIRTAIVEAMEAAGSFSYGYFEGQPPQATGAKTAQSSTAQHWFDVVITPARRSPSSSVIAGNSRRQLMLDVRIPIVSRLPTPAQESSRSAVLADIETECAAAARALSQPGAISFTAADEATGIAGGLMTNRDGRGEPSYRMVSEMGSSYTIKVELTGTVTVTADDTPASLADLGADLLYCWDVPAADSPLIEFDGSNVVQLEHSGSAASAPLVSGTPSLVAHHTTGANGPWLSVAPGDPYTTLDAVPSVASGSRIAIYTVCIPGADNLGTGMPGTIPDGFGYPHAVYDGIWGFDGYDDQDAGTTYLSASDETAIGPDEAGLSYQARAVHASDSTPRIYCTAYLHSGCVGTVGTTPVAPSYTYTGGSGLIESYYVGCQAFYFSAIVAFADAETFAHHDAIVRAYIEQNRGIT